MAPWSAVRSLLASAVVSSSAGIAASQAQPPPVPDILQLSGACDGKGFLNAAYFDKQGHTANGSPYFKARGIESYLYFDADCAGGGDGAPRWILDNDRPNLGFMTDLDGDLSCEYQARINSHDGYSPPFTGTWRMECDGVWQDSFLILLLISTTSTTTTSRTMTSSTVTGRTITSTRTTLTRSGTRTRTTMTRTSTSTRTTTTVTTTSPPVMFVLSGACEFKGFLNGLVFREEGHTANGSPYFKSLTDEQYMYYDIDCDGGHDGTPRWIFDSSRPALDRFEDVDGDGRCDYHASMESDHAVLPPDEGAWKVFCGEAWVDLELDLSFDPQDLADHMPAMEEDSDHPSEAEEAEADQPTEQGASGHPTRTRTEHGESNPTAEEEEEEEADSEHPTEEDASNAQHEALKGLTLRIAGACQELDELNEVEFVQQGATATGAPYFVSMFLVPEQYIYYDPACAGASGDFEGRWVIDDDHPDVSRHADLDGDRRCDYLASTVDASTSSVPAEATWRMKCGGKWVDVPLTVTEVVQEAEEEEQESKDTPPISSMAPSRRGASVLSAAFFASLAALSLL